MTTVWIAIGLSYVSIVFLALSVRNLLKASNATLRCLDAHNVALDSINKCVKKLAGIE